MTEDLVGQIRETEDARDVVARMMSIRGAVKSRVGASKKPRGWQQLKRAHRLAQKRARRVNR